MDRSYRQQIVDEFLNAVGENFFSPAAFLDWLKPQKSHRAWGLFFGRSEKEAAEAHRLALVRQFISGLRIVVSVSMRPSKAKKVSVVVRMPAYISPMSNRREGGGYYATDVHDKVQMRELARQAAIDLRRVHERNEGIGQISGIDISVLLNLAEQFDAAGLPKAAAAE